MQQEEGATGRLKRWWVQQDTSVQMMTAASLPSDVPVLHVVRRARLERQNLPKEETDHLQQYFLVFTLAQYVLWPGIWFYSIATSTTHRRPVL